MIPDERRRVVLYNPRAEHWTMPLALLALASNLDRSRLEPVIIDGRLEQDPVARVLEHCDTALCLGCTVLSGAPIADAIELCRAVKSRSPGLPVIWGGWHPSIYPRSCLEEASVDIAVQGQGEPTLIEIIERLLAGEQPGTCSGCTVRGPTGEVHSAPARAMVDPGELAPPDYSLIDIERYFALKQRRQLDYVSSLGCPFRCRFCADPVVYGRHWAGLEPERIAADLESIWKRWRFEDVSFQDETFFTSTRRALGIATQLLERGLGCTWAATMRADQGARLSEVVFELCARSGLRRVIVGVESATESGLRRLGKDITLEQVHITAERCARSDIAATLPFIVGLPGEPFSEVEAALSLAAELRSMHPRFETPFFFYQPYPGTQLSQQLAAIGHQLPVTLEQWAGFDFVGTAGAWVPDEVRALVEPLTITGQGA